MNIIFKNWSSEDMLQGRYYADLGEYGEFSADIREPLEIFSPWQISVKGSRTCYQDDEILEEQIELYIELHDALTDEEIDELSAGEILKRGWRSFTF